MKSLVWFRNDLRIDDNQALRNACMISSEVHCVYLYSLNQNEAHNEANCKTHFIIENLKSLEELGLKRQDEDVKKLLWQMMQEDQISA